MNKLEQAARQLLSVLEQGLIDINAVTALREALAEQAEQSQLADASLEPVAVVEITYGREPECYVTGNIDEFPEGVFKLYAAPVRTKDPCNPLQDLTDDEIAAIAKERATLHGKPEGIAHDFARAVIAADREKNK